MIKEQLGKRICELRKQMNISQEELAEKLDISQRSLSKIETGRNYPQPETIEKIAKALNVNINHLFSFQSLNTKNEYIEAITQNINLIQNNEEKLKLLYTISSALI